MFGLVDSRWRRWWWRRGRWGRGGSPECPTRSTPSSGRGRASRRTDRRNAADAEAPPRPGGWQTTSDIIRGPVENRWELHIWVHYKAGLLFRNCPFKQTSVRLWCHNEPPSATPCCGCNQNRREVNRLQFTYFLTELRGRKTSVWRRLMFLWLFISFKSSAYCSAERCSSVLPWSSETSLAFCGDLIL